MGCCKCLQDLKICSGNCAGPGIQILLAHVRRWKSDARFFQALRKASFSLVDADCGRECAPKDKQIFREEVGGCQRDAALIVNSSSVDHVARQKQNSLHTKGALKIFRLHKSGMFQSTSSILNKC